MLDGFKKLFSLKRGPDQIAGARRYIPGVGSFHVNEDTAMSVAAFHRGVTYIATQIAKLPWTVKDKTNNIQEGEIANLLDLAPNPEMNAFTARVLMVMQALQLGNSYWEIQRDMMNRPVALWPLDPKAVDLIRIRGELYYRVAGGSSDYAYTDAYLPAGDVFHVRNFHTKDGLVGQGLVAYASETLGISRAADKMASGIFTNGGVPAGVLTYEGALTDEAFDRLKNSWKEQNNGRKAGGVAILENGVKFNTLNLDPDVLQFLESRKFGVLEIARFLGLPPTKLFDASTATYSNVENANLEVATDTLDSWAVNLEMEADVKLLNKRYAGRFTELDLYAVFRGDMTTRANYFSKMMQIGAMTPNQVRAREGQPGYGKDGDRYFIAVNNYTPADRLDEVIDAQIKGKEPKDVTPPPKSEEDLAAKEADKQLTAAALRILEK